MVLGARRGPWVGNRAGSICGRTVSWAAQALPAWGPGEAWEPPPRGTGRRARSGTYARDSKRSARALWPAGPDRVPVRPAAAQVRLQKRKAGFPSTPPPEGTRGPTRWAAGTPKTLPRLLPAVQTRQVPTVAREDLTLASATAAPGPEVRSQPVAQALEPCDLPTATSVPSPTQSS